MLEGLTKYWGFYFVAAPDGNGVGVRDLQDALDDMAEDWEWRSDLERVDEGARANQEKDNSLIASETLRKVLAAHSHFPVVFTARGPGRRGIAGEA